VKAAQEAHDGHSHKVAVHKDVTVSQFGSTKSEETYQRGPYIEYRDLIRLVRKIFDVNVEK
jgi:hypothetical protein